MSLSPSGSLAEIPVTDLILELIRARQSGVLEVVQGKVKKQVAFSDGIPVAVQSNAMSESLGRLLETSGRVTPERVAEIREAAKEQRRSLEALIVEQRVVTAEELARLQNVLNQIRLLGLYLWTEGTYRFAAQPVPAGPALPLPGAVMQLARKRAEAGPLLKQLEPRRRERPRAVAQPPFALADFGLSSESNELYASLDGKRELGEVLLFSGRPPEEVALLIFVFTLTGMIDDASLAAAVTGLREPAESRTAPPAMVTPPPTMVTPPPPTMVTPPPPTMVTPPPEAKRSSEPPVVVAMPVAARTTAESEPPVIVATPVMGRLVENADSRRTSEPPVIVATPVMGRPVGTPDTKRPVDAPVTATPVMGRPVEAAAAATTPSAPAAPAVSAPAEAPAEEDEEGAFTVDSADIGGVGRYVIGRAEERRTGAENIGGLSIDDMIAQEIGELDGSVPIVTRKVDTDPLLDINMSGFTPQQRDLANRFKEDFLRIHKQNYFELLGVDRRAKAADIRKNYFLLAKEYHTDRLVNLPEAVQRLGREIFNVIQTAYDTLTDPDKREKYVAATFYGKAGEEEAAIEEVQTVLQADQHFKMGIGLLNAGNLPGAHAAFGRARDLYSKEAEYNACFGFTLFRLNFPGNPEKCEEGEKLIHDALRLNPKLDRANVFLGRIYVAKENYDQAMKYYVRALKINPTNLEAGREAQQLKARKEQQDTGLLSSLFGRFKKS